MLENRKAIAIAAATYITWKLAVGGAAALRTIVAAGKAIRALTVIFRTLTAAQLLAAAVPAAVVAGIAAIGLAIEAVRRAFTGGDPFSLDGLVQGFRSTFEDVLTFGTDALDSLFGGVEASISDALARGAADGADIMQAEIEARRGGCQRRGCGRRIGGDGARSV